MRWLLGWLFPPEERREGSDFTASWERDLARRLAPQEYELAPPQSRSRRYLDLGAQGRKFEPMDRRWRKLNTASVARPIFDVPSLRTLMESPEAIHRRERGR